MSYRIQYQTIRKNHRKEYHRIRRAVLTLLCFSLFLVFVCNVWTDAAKVVKDALLALRPAIVVSRMDNMAEAFRDGMNVTTAMEQFFQNLIQEEDFASG